MSNVDWRAFVNSDGDFELPNYLYRLNSDLMKQALDLGTLLSEDKAKLRAFKEQVKKTFKKRWLETAEVLEFFELITPCSCEHTEYCTICGGSRYQLNYALSPNQMREVGVAVGVGKEAELADKLQKGLLKALREIDELS